MPDEIIVSSYTVEVSAVNENTSPGLNFILATPSYYLSVAGAVSTKNFISIDTAPDSL